MRFYVVTLSIYSVAVTVLAVLLMQQNRELKSGGQQVAIDYNMVHDIDTQDIPMMGPDDAEVTIIEFSDFECQFCAQGSGVVKRLIDDFPGKVRIGFKNLPLDFHKQARPAASAALAAFRQGKFWEMEERLFANQKSLGDELYVGLAEELGLDMEQFNEQRKVENWTGYIEMQMDEARQAQANGTPTFFVNGVKVTGANYETLKEVVARVLSKGES